MENLKVAHFIENIFILIGANNRETPEQETEWSVKN